MHRYLLPLGIFVALAIFLGVGLKLNPREVPSPLVGKAAPVFNLPQLHDSNKTIAPENLRGKVWLLNVWASWCASCREEHPVLVELSKKNIVSIYGLNYKDKREDGLAWLREFGNPYVASAYDNAGQAGIDWGVYGVPETFIIDKAGVIRYKHIGPVTPKALEEKMLPLIKVLNNE